MIEIKAGQFKEAETGKDARTCSLLYPMRSRNGFLFCLIAVEKKHGKELKELCYLLEIELEQLAEEFERDANVQHRFEQFLAKANSLLFEGSKAGHWRMPIKDLNAIIGIAAGEEMYLSGTGELTALFLHKTPQQRYQIFNLSRGIQTEQARLTWEKPFAVILDGALHKNDVFCLASRELKSVISNEELHSILSTLPPESASAKIRQYFPHKTALSILILKASPLTDEAEAKPHSHVSVAKLGKTETETERLLEDQSPKRLMKRLLQFLKREKREEESVPRRPFRRLARLGLKTSMVLLKLFRWTKRLDKKTRESEDLAERVRENLRRSRNPNKLAASLQGLPKPTKYLGVAALGILLIFAVSIAVLSKSETRSAETDFFDERLAEVTNLIEQGDAALIYKDENQARGYYVEALALAEQLPRDTESRAEEAIRIQNELNESLDELRHLVHIPEPPVFVALPDSERIMTFTRGKSGFYALTENGEVFEIDEDSKEAIRLSLEEHEAGRPLEATEDETGVYFLDDRPGLTAFEDSIPTLVPTIHAPQGERSWADLRSYNNRLYVLEPELGDSEGQIIRFSRGGANWARPQKWIKSKTTDLKDAAGLAIDGTVFVLKQNGVIVRFQSGSEVDWPNAIVDPPITEATDIWTDSNSDFVYVLEPSQKRLLVFRKENGAFLQQYRSEQFSDLTDFTVDEAKNAVFLSSGPNIYRITTNHAE